MPVFGQSNFKKIQNWSMCNARIQEVWMHEGSFEHKKEA